MPDDSGITLQCRALRLTGLSRGIRANGNRTADREHPFGDERYCSSCLSTLFGFVCATALGTGTTRAFAAHRTTIAAYLCSFCIDGCNEIADRAKINIILFKKAYGSIIKFQDFVYLFDGDNLLLE